MFGDVNQDGIVNVLDALAIANYDNGMTNEITSEESKLAADVVYSKNKQINIIDALRIAYFDNELSGTSKEAGNCY